MRHAMWTKTRLGIVAAALIVTLVAIPASASLYTLYDAERMLGNLRLTLSKKTSGAIESRYQFHFTGDPSADYYIQINQNGSSVRTGTIDGPKCTWTSSVDDFVLVSKGRLDLTKAVQDKRVSLSGVGPLCQAIISSL